MWRGVRYLQVCLLVLALGHVPIPWAHSHDRLNGEQLAHHLQQYHRNCPPSNLPSGWHWHFDSFGLAKPDNDVLRAELPSTHREQVRLALSTVNLLESAAYPDIADACGTFHFLDGPARVALPERDLFKQFGAFLI
jgi:hypothetical protein